MALVDELWSGVAVAGAPSVEHELALTHSHYFFFAFALPLVVAAVVEGSVVAISDRLDRRRVLSVSQAALAASLFAVAITNEPWTMGLALAAAGTASGIACSAAQATMITTSDRGGDREMLAWSLFSSFGDMQTPVVTSAVLARGHTYRAAMATVGAIVLAQSIAARVRAPSDAPSADEDMEPDTAISRAFSRAIRVPRLWLWLFASASCTLLDEIVIAVVALRLVREGRATEAVAALTAVCFAAGAAAGSLLADKLVERLSARRILSTTAVAALVSLLVLTRMHGWAPTALSLFVLGVVIAPHHPLSLARAYETLPENPGVVQACLQFFVAVEVGAPIAVGVVADRFGLSAALACLALQPIVILTCALATKTER